MVLLRLARKYFWRHTLQPEYVIFHATSWCNLHCKHCFLWKKNSYGWGNLNQGKNDLAFEEIQKISQSMNDFFFLNIGGGEPFSRKALPNIVKTFYQNNHIQNLLIPTNGTLNKEILISTKKILEECPKLKVSIDVSIDGLEQLHNEIRGGTDVFKKAVKSLNSLVALKKEYPNLQVGVIISHMFYNQKHLLQIYDFLKKRVKPDSITLALTRGTPRWPKAKNIEIKYYQELCQKMEDDFLYGNVTGFRKVILWPLIITAKILMHRLVISTYCCGFQVPCLAGQLNAVIYSNGDVYPCEMLTKSRIGNLREAGYDFQKLWTSKTLRQIVGQIKKSKCFCTHECHLPINILFSPKMLPKIIWLSLCLLTYPIKQFKLENDAD